MPPPILPLRGRPAGHRARCGRLLRRRSPDHRGRVRGGVLCVWDEHPRELGPEDIAALEHFARDALALLELRRVTHDLESARALLAASGTVLEMILAAAAHRRSWTPWPGHWKHRSRPGARSCCWTGRCCTTGPARACRAPTWRRSTASGSGRPSGPAAPRHTPRAPSSSPTSPPTRGGSSTARTPWLPVCGPAGRYRF